MGGAMVDANSFRILGRDMSREAVGIFSMAEERRFRALFGTTPEVCSIIWEKIGMNRPKKGTPQHLLWSLLFLKVYASEDVLSVITQSDRKTQRKWTWEFVTAISNLRMVCSLLL